MKSKKNILSITITIVLCLVFVAYGLVLAYMTTTQRSQNTHNSAIENQENKSFKEEYDKEEVLNNKFSFQTVSSPANCGRDHNILNTVPMPYAKDTTLYSTSRDSMVMGYRFYYAKSLDDTSPISEVVDIWELRLVEGTENLPQEGNKYFGINDERNKDCFYVNTYLNRGNKILYVNDIEFDFNKYRLFEYDIDCACYYINKNIDLLELKNEAENYINYTPNSKDELIIEPLFSFKVLYTGAYNLEGTVVDADFENANYKGDTQGVCIAGTLKEIVDYSKEKREVDVEFNSVNLHDRPTLLDNYQVITGQRRAGSVSYISPYEFCTTTKKTYSLVNGYNLKYSCFKNGILNVEILDKGSLENSIKKENWYFLYASIMSIANINGGDEKVNEAQKMFKEYVEFAGNTHLFDNPQYNRFFIDTAYYHNNNIIELLDKIENDNGLYILNGQISIEINAEETQKQDNYFYVENSNVYSNVALDIKDITKVDLNQLTVTFDCNGTEKPATGYVEYNGHYYYYTNWSTPDIYNNKSTVAVNVEVKYKGKTIKNGTINLNLDVHDIDSIDEFKGYKVAENPLGYEDQTKALYQSLDNSQISGNRINFHGKEYTLGETNYNGIYGVYKDETMYSANKTTSSGKPIQLYNAIYNTNVYPNVINNNSVNMLAIYPEYNYDTSYGTLLNITQNSNQYKNAKVIDRCKNPSLLDVNAHAIPVWWNDGSYTINTLLFNVWLPVGPVYAYDSWSYNIQGSVYGDWYITRNKG